ncbi:MAG: fasciclin domain-containing protein [Myxococcota bacterium]
MGPSNPWRAGACLVCVALLPLGCSRTFLEGGLPGDAGAPAADGFVDGLIRLPPDASPGSDGGTPDASRPDAFRPDAFMPDGAASDGGRDLGPEDMFVPDLGPPARCRVVATRTCGTFGELPCVVAQLAESSDTSCAFQAYAAAAACVPGALLQLGAVDLLLPERSLFAPTDAPLLEGAASLGVDAALLSEPVTDCAELSDDETRGLGELLASLTYLITEGRQTAARLARTEDAAVRSVVGRIEGGEGIKVYLVPGAATLRYVDGTRSVRRANIVRPNVRVTAGRGDADSIVHVIDAFVAPPNLLDAMLLEGLDALVAALEEASPAVIDGAPPLPLTDGLEDPARVLTVFAPSDGAFRAFGPLPEPDALRDQLLFHSSENVRGFLLADLPVRLTMLDGNFLTIARRSIPVRVTSGGGSAFVEGGDVQATNGVLHIIDGVLSP